MFQMQWSTHIYQILMFETSFVQIDEKSIGIIKTRYMLEL